MRVVHFLHLRVLEQPFLLLIFATEFCIRFGVEKRPENGAARAPKTSPDGALGAPGAALGRLGRPWGAKEAKNLLLSQAQTDRQIERATVATTDRQTD